jgi:antitoxin PrlF
MRPSKRSRSHRPIAYSRLTSKGQATIPFKVRKILSLRSGDRVLFEESETGEILVHKAEPLDLEFLKSLEGTLTEWNSKNDDEAYGDL